MTKISTRTRRFAVTLVLGAMVVGNAQVGLSASGACKIWNDEANDVYAVGPYQWGAQKVPGVRAPYSADAMDIRRLKYSVDGENLRIDIQVADVNGPANPVTERINYEAFIIVKDNYPLLDPRNSRTAFLIGAVRDHGQWTFGEGQNQYSPMGDLIFPAPTLEGRVDVATNTISIFKPLRDIDLSQGTVLRDIHVYADDRVLADSFPSNGAYSGSAFRFDVAGACPQ